MNVNITYVPFSVVKIGRISGYIYYKVHCSHYCRIDNIALRECSLFMGWTWGTGVLIFFAEQNMQSSLIIMKNIGDFTPLPTPFSAQNVVETKVC